MLGWIRNIIFIGLVLSIIYVLLSFTARRKQRAKLLADYKADNATEEQDVFLAKGLQKYDRSLKPKLIFGVFLVPLALVSLLVFLAQNT